MSSMRKFRGFSVVELIIIVVIVGVLGFIGWRILAGQFANKGNDTQPASTVSWTYGGSSWTATGSPPACPSPLLSPPADFSKATSLLYPGQTRGGDYKPHGGLRFNNSKSSDITVKLAMDAQLYRGSRYLQDGYLQYLFDFITPCGIMLRYDHLQTLSADFQAIANTMPAPQEGDSRTTNLSGAYKAGTIIASAVGLSDSNVFFDLGVYDLRQQNESAKNDSYKQAHADEAEQAYYAICWFDQFDAANTSKLTSLTAMGVEGTKSDYCK